MSRLHLESNEMIDRHYVWMGGFDEAVYDSVFERGTLPLRHKFGIQDCGEEYESKEFPPYCHEGVQIAADYFDGGVADLITYVKGYRAGSIVLAGMSRGVHHV